MTCSARRNSVHELRATEAGLRESEERFRFMADTAPVMIWLAGRDKRYDFVNQRWTSGPKRSSRRPATGGPRASIPTT